MNITMNLPASQPAQPASQPFGNLSMPQPNAVLERSKTVEKIIAFPKSLPNEIDALRFSGPEQFFAGAPYISVQKSNVVFSTPI